MRAIICALMIALPVTVLAHDYDESAKTYIHTDEALDSEESSGEECLVTKRTRLTIKVIEVDCESVKDDATKIDHEVANLARRLGAKRDVFKTTVLTLTTHRIIFPWSPSPGVTVQVLADGVTRPSASRSVMRWGITYRDPYDVLVHELGHVAWGLAGTNSAFLDSHEDSVEKRAIVNRETNKRVLPKDHPVTKALRAL